MKKIFAFLLLAALSTASFAQLQNPAHWSYSVKDLGNDEAELLFTAKLDAGWHIYSQHTDPNGPIALEFTFTDSKHYKRIGAVVEPKAHEEFDDVFKCTVRSFTGTVTFRQKIKTLYDKPFQVEGSLYYQLCNDGSCIAPDDVPFSITVTPTTNETAATEAPSEETEAPADSTIEDAIADSPTDTIATTPEDNTPQEKKQSLLLVFFIALGSGILTMFTPCVFPMIPMTVNFFMHSSDNKRKNRRQAWAFGLSIVFIFAVIGALLSLVFGPDSLNFIGTHGVPNLIFFVIFFVFSLSFFGLFEIKMPEKWVNASDAQADKGGLMAPFFIALTTVLVSFSCTGPIISAALVEFATSSTNRWIGLVSMLGFGIGFALPFTLLAFFPSALKNMKSGGWLNSVKIVFAFLELAFGLKFLSMADIYWGWRLLDREVYLALWITIFSLMGLYLLGKIKFKGEEDVKHMGIVRLFLVIATFSFVIYMVPGMFGAPLKGISGFLPPMNTQDFNIEQMINNAGISGAKSSDAHSTVKYESRLKTYSVPGYTGEFYDLDEAKNYAKQVDKPIFIDFTGINCGNCREMENAVWGDAEIKKTLSENFVICALYCDANDIKLDEADYVTDDNGRVLKTLGRKNLYFQRSKYQMNAQPYYVIIDANDDSNKPLTKENFSYKKDVKKFLAFLNEALENYSKK